MPFAIDTKAPQILSLRELATILIKHFDYHEGLYDLGFGVQIAVGRVGPVQAGPEPEAQFPGAAFGISGVGLSKANVVGPFTVDAAEVNPRSRPTKAVKRNAPRKAKSV